jgi:hypothetical protein
MARGHARVGGLLGGLTVTCAVLLALIWFWVGGGLLGGLTVTCAVLLALIWRTPLMDDEDDD